MKGEVIHSTVYRKYTGTTRAVDPEYTLPLASPHRHLELTHQYLKVHLSVLERVLLVQQLWIWVRLLYLSSLYVLAPSVDGGLSGGLGQRDIINRMQLKLNTVGVVLTHDCEVSMILNSDLSTTAFENVQSPSLCQTIKHEIGQEIFGGSNLFQFRASGGPEDSAGQNTSNTSNFTLGEVIDLGNSILGGDGVFPNGILTF